MEEKSYHQRIKEEKRRAAIQAAKQLFFEQGYERTSLQQIAAQAGVSTATLFKRFPSKAALFAAMVEEFWAVENKCAASMPAKDPRAGLTKIGLDYARRMRQPDMRAMFRLIVAEAPRFPDLGQMLFQKGFGPFWSRLTDYLTIEKSAGTLLLDNPSNVARAFLATIAGQVLWPELVVAGCGGSDDSARQVVKEAVETTLARYAADQGEGLAAMSTA